MAKPRYNNARPNAGYSFEPVGVPFQDKAGKTRRVVDIRDTRVKHETYPEYCHCTIRFTECQSDAFVAEFGFKPIIRIRLSGDGLGPLLIGDVVSVPHTYPAIFDGQGKNRRETVPERVYNFDTTIIGVFDMRYYLHGRRLDHDGTRPFLLNVAFGIAKTHMDPERITDLGFTIDFDLLTAMATPIPWVDPSRNSPAKKPDLIPLTGSWLSDEEAFLRRRRQSCQNEEAAHVV